MLILSKEMRRNLWHNSCKNFTGKAKRFWKFRLQCLKTQIRISWQVKGKWIRVIKLGKGCSTIKKVETTLILKFNVSAKVLVKSKVFINQNLQLVFMHFNIIVSSRILTPFSNVVSPPRNDIIFIKGICSPEHHMLILPNKSNCCPVVRLWTQELLSQMEICSFIWVHLYFSCFPQSLFVSFCLNFAQWYKSRNRKRWWKWIFLKNSSFP